MVSKLDGPTAEEMAYIQAVRMVLYAVDKKDAALVAESVGVRAAQRIRRMLDWLLGWLACWLQEGWNLTRLVSRAKRRLINGLHSRTG